MNDKKNRYSSVQRRIMEQEEGVFDLASRPGRAPAPKEPPAAKEPEMPEDKPVKPEGTDLPEVPEADSPNDVPDLTAPQKKKSSDNTVMQVEKLIDAYELMNTASEDLETAAAYIAASKGPSKMVADGINKMRSGLMTALSDVKSNIIKMGEEDPVVAEKVQSWIKGDEGDLGLNADMGAMDSGGEQAPSEDIPIDFDLDLGAEQSPKSAPMPPEAAPLPPEAAQGGVPAPAPAAPSAAPMPPPAAGAPAAPQQPPAVPPAVPPMESLTKALNKILRENGVTRERKQTSQPKTLAIQPIENRSSGSKEWYMKGVKGNGYGKGGRFNDH